MRLLTKLIFDPPGGTYTSSVTVGIRIQYDSGSIGDAKDSVIGVFCTLDGTDPANGGTRYGGAIQITKTSTLKAISLNFLGLRDANASETYTIVGVPPPTFSPPAATYNNYNNGNNFQVSLSADSNRDILCTTDGSSPSISSTKYGSPITFLKSTTIKAKAYSRNLIGMYTYGSSEASATYILKTAKPSIKPKGGIYHNTPLNVSMECATIGHKIQYTTDGTDPTPATGRPYAPFQVEKSCTVKAMASRKNFEDSDIANAKYTFKTAAPVIQPPSGTYTGNISVSISCKTLKAIISYSNSPSNVGTNYTGPFIVFAPGSGTATVKITARAFRKDFIDSDSASVTYILMPKPILDPTVRRG